MRDKPIAARRGPKGCQSRRLIHIACAATLISPLIAQAQSNQDIIGLTKLTTLDPTLNGAGVTLGQAEANNGSTNYEYEVNPALVGRPAGLFTYVDQYGNVSTSFTPSAESTHADAVGGIIYGGAIGNGMAPGIAHVDDYSADYFFNSIIFWGTAIPDKVVNQSFNFATSNNPSTNLFNQQSSDTSYDNYIDKHGTIIITGAGSGIDTPYPVAPSTNYNGIAVGVDNGSSALGPTFDNGRSKPDITAPDYYTSFSTAMVSGAAALLVQAGARGDGGNTAQLETQAVDPRTVKALLLNGADKQAVTFNRTHTAPLDPTNGAGLLNVYNSYEQLAAGNFGPGSISNTLALGGIHPPDPAAPTIISLAGWSFGTLTSSLLTDAYANYVFSPPTTATSYALTATLVWERQFNNNPSKPMGINNLDLYLYDTTANTVMDCSTSTVDNVQDVYDLNLTPGHRYDLEVLKTGGIPGVSSGVVSNSETYALAFNFAPMQSVWNVSTGGSAASAANWSGAVPNIATITAIFAGAITTPSTVTFPANWVVGNINFDNSHSYTIASTSGGPLILDNGAAAATATITDTGGSHIIAAPLQLNSNLAVSISNATDALSFTGNITDNPTGPGAAVTLNGTGTLTLSGTNSYRQSTTVNSGELVIASTHALPTGSTVINHSALTLQAGTAATPVISGSITGSGNLTIGSASPAYLQLAAGSGASSQSSLTLSAGSTLDLTNNSLTINYSAASADPVASIAASLSASYHAAGGAWTGTGITSSLAAANPTRYAIGYMDGDTDPTSPAQPNQIIIKYTLAGDAFLDGTVGFDDLVVLAQNFGRTGEDWAGGNFTYDPQGSVGFADLVLLAQNFGQSVQSSDAPGGLGIGPAVQSVAISTSVLPDANASMLGALAAGWALTRRRRSPRAAK